MKTLKYYIIILFLLGCSESGEIFFDYDEEHFSAKITKEFTENYTFQKDTLFLKK